MVVLLNWFDLEVGGDEGKNEGVRRVVPTLEGWFQSSYEQLGTHADTHHSASPPDSHPCCPRLPLPLLLPTRLPSDIRTILHVHNLDLNWYGMGALYGGMHEVVEWMLGVGARLLDGRGGGPGATLRRADILGIVGKAPVFSGIQPRIDAAQRILARLDQRTDHPAATDDDHDTEGAELIPSPTLGALAIYEPVPKAKAARAERTLNKNAEEEMTVEELAGLVSERLRVKLDESNPVMGAPISKHVAPEPLQTATTRYVVCTDKQFPWMSVNTPGDSLILIQSTGCETDDTCCASRRDCVDISAAEEMEELREEVARLKALLLQLLSK